MFLKLVGAYFLFLGFNCYTVYKNNKTTVLKHFILFQNKIFHFLTYISEIGLLFSRFLIQLVLKEYSFKFL